MLALLVLIKYINYPGRYRTHRQIMNIKQYVYIWHLLGQINKIWKQFSEVLSGCGRISWIYVSEAAKSVWKWAKQIFFGEYTFDVLGLLTRRRRKKGEGMGRELSWRLCPGVLGPWKGELCIWTFGKEFGGEEILIPPVHQQTLEDLFKRPSNLVWASLL